MIEKIGHIKNPLTIIAIFAGIAEISGTIVLPFISEANQNKFIWFLMLFPALLVLIFFVTLWHKPRSLYAPSDYTNEDNFVRMMEPATYFEVEAKAQHEAATASMASNGEPDQTEQVNVDSTETPSSSDTHSRRRNVLEAYMMAEDRVFSDLSKEFPTLKRNIALTKSGSRIVFDGVVETDNGLTVFEVKIIKTVDNTVILKSASQFAAAINKVFPLSDTNLRPILVVAIREGSEADRQAVQTEVNIGGRNILVRLITLKN